VAVTPPSFDHVFRMSDNIGMFEHADHITPRGEHGYCVDDVARLLIVIAREPEPGAALGDLERTALRFLADAQAVDGRVRNRRCASGRWNGPRSVADCWGRSLWAFGTATRRSRHAAVRQAALAYFDHGTQQRSPHVRSMAFAALGAAEVLAIDPRHDHARRLMVDAADKIGRPRSDPLWPWPEPRLSYANAALPEALIAAGHLLERSDLIDDGLRLLRWLMDRETVEGHLSPTPVGGSGPGDTAPGFDQQPIEVAAMADACHRAYIVTGQHHWLTGVQMATEWFAGDNDAGTPMFDADSGGGYDGLQASGPNLNEGAESTLALLSTLQHGRRLTILAQ
jgi:hypothetical protein